MASSVVGVTGENELSSDWELLNVMQRHRKEHKKKMREECEERQRQRDANNLKERPMSDRSIEFYLTSSISADTMEKYFSAFQGAETRSDIDNPEVRYISHHQMGRMNQLIRCFPDGVAEDHFVETFESILGTKLILNGYSFPCDDDSTAKFKLTSLFWIPSIQGYNLPQKILFPRDSCEKFKNSLKAVFQEYWNIFVTKFPPKKVLELNDSFSDESAIYHFHAATGIWFHYKRWRLSSYTQFIEILLQIFDPKEERYTIRYCLEKENCLSQSAYLLEAGYYADEFMNAVHRKFAGITEINEIKQKGNVQETRERITITWNYKSLNFVGLKKIQRQDSLVRIHDVVSAGNVRVFHKFCVILVKDIEKQDKLLEKLDQLVDEDEKYTVPWELTEKCIVVFQNQWYARHMWRRGIVLRTDGKDGTLTVMDIDTGEVHSSIPVALFRNITPAVYQLPVYNIPVRFSVDWDTKKVYTQDLEADNILGKYLHMMLVEGNKGLRLRFHWWDTHTSWYFPGVWVATGYLINILTSTPLRPRVSLSYYLLDKYARRDKDEKLPEWRTVETKIDYNDWSSPQMIQRYPSIKSMMNTSTRLDVAKKAETSYHISLQTSSEFNVDENAKEWSVGRIHTEQEYGGCFTPFLGPIFVGKGIAKIKRLQYKFIRGERPLSLACKMYATARCGEISPKGIETPGS